MTSGQLSPVEKTRHVVPEGDGLASSSVYLLTALHRRRKFAMSVQSKVDRSTESYLASLAGLDRNAPERVRKAIWRQVSAVRKEVERADRAATAEEAITGLSARELPEWADSLVILAAKLARESWDRIRKDCERQIEQIVKRLPIWPWIAKVRGLGAMGAGCLIAEAGAL